jgi:hypothetical protein
MEFKASLDNLTKIITSIIFIIPVVIGVRLFNSAQIINADFIFSYGSIVLLFILILLVCYLFHTRKYIVSNQELIIKRPVKERKIPISDMEEIRLIKPGEMLGTIRTFGVGGLFGYYGLFYNKTFGSMTLYTTQRKNRIFIRTKTNGKIVISPDDLSLVELLKSRLAVV